MAHRSPSRPSENCKVHLLPGIPAKEFCPAPHYSDQIRSLPKTDSKTLLTAIA